MSAKRFVLGVGLSSNLLRALRRLTAGDSEPFTDLTPVLRARPSRLVTDGLAQSSMPYDAHRCLLGTTTRAHGPSAVVGHYHDGLRAIGAYLAFTTTTLLAPPSCQGRARACAAAWSLSQEWACPLRLPGTCINAAQYQQGTGSFVAAGCGAFAFMRIRSIPRRRITPDQRRHWNDERHICHDPTSMPRHYDTYILSVRCTYVVHTISTLYVRAAYHTAHSALSSTIMNNTDYA